MPKPASIGASYARDIVGKPRGSKERNLTASALRQVRHSIRVTGAQGSREVIEGYKNARMKTRKAAMHKGIKHRPAGSPKGGQFF